LSDIANILKKQKQYWQKLSFWAKWKVMFTISILLLIPGIFTVIKILQQGLGVLPLNNNVVWGNFIVNFIFWIGIAHAGTFISAILLLLRQGWRHEIHRFAEILTIIAIIIAALMPVLHLGKPGLFYKILPLTDKTGLLLLNFNSPLVWDFYAILTYLLVSLLFFSSDFLPFKLIYAKEHSFKHKQTFYLTNKQLLQLGNSQYIMAIIATPLVISVHSIVSYDFAVSLRSGWHNSFFPVYFVVGAVMSGFAMIGLLAPFAAKHPSFINFFTVKHQTAVEKIIFGCAIFLSFIFLNELLGLANAHRQSEIWLFLAKLKIPMIVIYIFSLFATLILPLYFIRNKFKTPLMSLQLICLLILIGMWFERYIIVVGSALSAEIPSQFSSFQANIYSFALTVGIAALFSCLFLLALRYFPLISNIKFEVNKNTNDSEFITISLSNNNEFQQVIQLFTQAGIHLKIPLNKSSEKNNHQTGKLALISILTVFPTAVFLQYYVHQNHGLVFGNKPEFPLLSFIPTAFVLSLLAASLLVFIRLLYKTRVKKSEDFEQEDCYLIQIKTDDYPFIEEKLKTMIPDIKIEQTL